jgi:hypothetical protein
MFGGFKIFVGDGLVMLFENKIPTTLETLKKDFVL